MWTNFLPNNILLSPTTFENLFAIPTFLHMLHYYVLGGLTG
jgi:hypothetical protein